jgi:hypothetical protein
MTAIKKVITVNGKIQYHEFKHMQLRHTFMESSLKYKYEPKHEYSFLNETYGEHYTPDWIVTHNDKTIIVEYYGMLDMSGVDYGYKEKYLKKHEYYNKLCNEDDTYMYIELIVDDIKHGLAGVKEKFREIGIEIRSSYC